MRKNKLGLFALLAAMVLLPAYFNPAAYPQRYFSGSAAVASGVIVASGPALLVGCEFDNANAATRYFMVFDSARVPADTASSELVFMRCAANTTCLWGMNGPNQTANGGTGVVFLNGISWANSSTLPKKTVGAADSTVACSFSQLNQ